MIQCRPPAHCLVAAVAVLVGGCPTVKVATDDKPITINLNVHIKHEILVKVDKALDEILDEQSGLF